MEADEYFQAYEAMKEDELAGSAGRLVLKVADPCGVSKIVWSSFDFMSGPELRFVWEVAPLNGPLTPVTLSGEEGSETHSLDSSLSTTSAQFDDIDDPLQNPLLSAVAEHIDDVIVDTGLDLYGSSPVLSYRVRHGTGGGQFLDDFMTDSRSTITGNTSLMQDSSNSNGLFDQSSSSGELSTLGMGSRREELPSSPTDPMSGTPVESLNMSQLLMEYKSDPNIDGSMNSQAGEVSTATSTNSTVTVLTHGSSISCLSEMEKTPIAPSDGVPWDCEHTLSNDVNNTERIPDKSGNSDVFTTSCVDSGIAGTISTHSDLSAFCNSPAAVTREKLLQRSIMETSIFRRRPSSGLDDGDVALDVDVPLNAPEDELSDERFVAKFVLAEQICSTQMPSNPLMLKVTVVPARSLLAVSYLFSLPHQQEDRRTMHALSLLMTHTRLEWYMQRERLFESIFADLIPRIKASIIKEEFDDVVVRWTTEMTRFIGLLGALDRFALIPNGGLIRIRQTFLGSHLIAENGIVVKAISGILQSQGYGVVIGNDHAFVSKLLLTLCLFIPQHLRWCCMRAYRHPYTPYIRLQAVERNELLNVVLRGAHCEWPVCIVDVDRNVVCLSASYAKHRLLKNKVETHVVKAILEQHNPKGRSQLKLELSRVKEMDQVRSLLSRLDLLPQEDSARMGFVDQFMLYIDNLARAFILYVKDASEPQHGEKECGVRSRRFSLSECRKALDLQHEGLFHTVLARAELLHPQIADFVFI